MQTNKNQVDSTHFKHLFIYLYISPVDWVIEYTNCISAEG